MQIFTSLVTITNKRSVLAVSLHRLSEVADSPDILSCEKAMQ